MASDLELELQIRLNEGQVLSRLERSAIASGKKIENELRRSLKSGLTTDKIRLTLDTSGIIASGKKIENELRRSLKSGLTTDKIRLTLDTSGIKAATADMKLLNAELREASKSLKAFGGIKITAPRQPSGSSASSNGAGRSALAEEQRLFQFRSAMTKQRIREESQGLSTVARLQKEVSAARLKGSGGSDPVARQLRHQIQLQQEAIRHAQTLARIKASPISPQAAAHAGQLARALNQINLSRLRQEFAQTEQTATRSLSGMRQGVGNLAANLAGGVTGAVASAGINAVGGAIGGLAGAGSAFLADSIKKTMSFNSALTMVQINTQATNEELQSIRETALDTASTFGILPEVTANLALELGRMGVSASDMPEYLNAIGSAARATGEDINIAKDAIAQTKAVFTDLDVGDIGDILTVGANVSPEGFQGIAQALSYVSGAAVDAKVPLTDVIEQITLLQSAGFRSDRAGTALTALYTDIKENAGVIEGFGVEVFDSSGQLRDMTTIITEVGQATKQMTDEQKAAALQKFDVNSTRALINLGNQYDKNAEKVKNMRMQLQAASKDNVSTTQAGKSFDDPKIKLEQLIAKIDQMRIKLGDAFMPAIDGALSFGNTLADALIKNETLFAGITQAAEEFQSYLEENPGLVDDLAAGLGEVATVLSQSILTETREILNHLRENPEQITAALNQMVDFASSIGECVKLAGDLAAAFNAVTSFVASLDTQLIGITIKLREFFGISDNGHLQSVFNRMNAQDQGLISPSGRVASGSSGNQPAPQGLTAAGQNAYTLSQTPEVRALLDAITTGEGTSGDSGYTTMFTGAQFSDMSRHPAQLQSGGGYTSDAAGRYQFLSTTFNPVAEQLGLPDFSPQSQDIAATQLLINRGAIDPLMSGNRAAVQDAIAPEWASVPTSSGGSVYGQPVVSSSEFWGGYEQSLARGSGDRPTSNASPSRAVSTPPPQPSLGDRVGADFTITVGGQQMTMDEYEKIRTGGTDRTNAGQVSSTAIPIQTYSVTMDGQNYGASRDGGARQHAGQDFDISGADAIAQTILGGVIAHITRSSAATGVGSYGNVVEIFNQATGLVERIAEMDSIPANLQVGQAVAPGATVGQGESESGVFHYELRTDGNAQGSQGSGFQGSVDPIKTYENLGLATFDGSRLTSTGRSPSGGVDYGGGVNPINSTDPSDVLTEAAKKAEQERKRLLKESQQNQDEAFQLRRQMRDQQRESNQDRERIALENSQAQLSGTPFEDVAQRQTQSFDLSSRYQDQIDTAKDELEDLQTQRQRLEERRAEPGMDAVIQGYEDAIKLQQEYITNLDSRLFMEQKNLEATQGASLAQEELAIRQQMAARSQALAVRTMVLEVERYVNQIKDPALQEFARSGFAANDISNSYADEIRQTEEEISALQNSLQQLSDAGIDMDSGEILIYQENLASLLETLDQLKKNRDVEIEVRVKQQDEAIAQFREDNYSALAISTADMLRRRGDNFGANKLQRADGQRTEVLRYGQQRRDLENSRSTLGDSVTDEMIGVATTQHGQNLDGIAAQYQTLGEAANEAGKEMVGSFLQSIAAGENFGQALVKVLDQLTSTIANMLIELAKTELFGNGLKGGLLGGNTAGGGAGDVLSAITGGLGLFLGGGGGSPPGMSGLLDAGLSGLAGLSEGTIPNYANGNAIAKAFQRERNASGAKPYLAVLNEDEIVLSGQQSRKFMAAGLDRVVNMATGNMPTSYTPTGSAPTINTPISITVDGGNAADVQQFAAGLQRQQRAIAASELNKALRPGGLLNRRR